MTSERIPVPRQILDGWLTGDGDPAGIAERGRRIVAVIRAVRETGPGE